MTRKHFIALADTVRAVEDHYGPFLNGSYQGLKIRDVLENYREALASFCQRENPSFDRQIWLDYIAGKCGPTGWRWKNKR